MIAISEAKKLEYWNHFSSQSKGIYTPSGGKIGSRFLKQAKMRIWNDDLFWLDIIVRHGGLYITPDEMKNKNPDVYNHCMGNFWGMLVFGKG